MIIYLIAKSLGGPLKSSSSISSILLSFSDSGLWFSVSDVGEFESSDGSVLSEAGLSSSVASVDSWGFHHSTPRIFF